MSHYSEERENENECRRAKRKIDDVREVVNAALQRVKVPTMSAYRQEAFKAGAVALAKEITKQLDKLREEAGS